MPIEAGEAVLSGDVIESRGDDGTPAAGDAVAIDATGAMTPANTEANELAGVLAEGGGLGLTGAYVAAADGAVVAGNRVGAGNATGGSTGQFIATADGPGLALSDTGGSWLGYDVPVGYAVVYL